MKFKTLLYILLAYLIVNLSACESLIDEYSEGQEEHISEVDVYLSITGVEADDTGTINEDNTNFEDRIHNLSLLIFDSFSGKKVCEYFDKEISSSDNRKDFPIKLTTGQRDFFFIANMPMGAIESISNKSEMIKYMNQFHDMDISLHKGASKYNGFPMSRVYLNQVISEGGNIYSPKPFLPIVNGISEDRVGLIRIVAKLEIVMAGDSISSGVKDIYYKNAYRQFVLTPNAYSTTILHNEAHLLERTGNSYIYYMPEAMMMNTNPVWSTTNHGPINYFIIETLEGTFYEIPIITDNGSISNTDYMTFATGQDSTAYPNYNIYRNRHYHYQIKGLQTIQIMYTIEPWIINRNSTFMGYGYNLNFCENGKIRVSNTVNACSPHCIKLRMVSPFTFNDGTTEKVFENREKNSYTEYTLSPIPQKGDGDYLELYYNDRKVRTFSK